MNPHGLIDIVWISDCSSVDFLSKSNLVYYTFTTTFSNRSFTSKPIWLKKKKRDCKGIFQKYRIMKIQMKPWSTFSNLLNLRWYSIQNLQLFGIPNNHPTNYNPCHFGKGIHQLVSTYSKFQNCILDRKGKVYSRAYLQHPC